jgi:hypothetical protein
LPSSALARQSREQVFSSFDLSKIAALLAQSLWNVGGKGSRTSSLKFKTAPLCVMSENKTSTKGCQRLDAAPRPIPMVEQDRPVYGD